MNISQELADCITAIRTNALQMRKGADEKQTQALDRINMLCDRAGMYLRGLQRAAKVMEAMSITLADTSTNLYEPKPVDPEEWDAQHG